MWKILFQKRRQVITHTHTHTSLGIVRTPSVHIQGPKHFSPCIWYLCELYVKTRERQIIKRWHIQDLPASAWAVNYQHNPAVSLSLSVCTGRYDEHVSLAAGQMHSVSPLSAPVTVMRLQSLHLLVYEPAGSSPNAYSNPLIPSYIFDLSKVTADWTIAVWFWLLSLVQT